MFTDIARDIIEDIDRNAALRIASNKELYRTNDIIQDHGYNVTRNIIGDIVTVCFSDWSLRDDDGKHSFMKSVLNSAADGYRCRHMFDENQIILNIAEIEKFIDENGFKPINNINKDELYRKIKQLILKISGRYSIIYYM